MLQEIRQKHAEALVEVTLSYADVVAGVHVDEIGSVSHRWLDPDEPDPDGAQLKAIKSFLAKPEAQKLKLIWIDAQSMPQDKHTGNSTDPIPFVWGPSPYLSPMRSRAAQVRR